MVWFRVDDGFCDHPKVEALLEGKHAGDAIALWTLAGSWCAKQLTNGEISTAKVARLGIPRHAKAAAELVRVRLWEKTATGFRFHAWEERQSLREEVEQARSAASERMRRIRASQRGETVKSTREKIHESENVRANNMRTDLANIERSSPDHALTSSSTHTIPFHSVPIRTKEQNQNSVLGDGQQHVALPSISGLVDESLRFPEPDAEPFNERDLERAVSEVRGTTWKIPVASFHRRQARETAALIVAFAHQHDCDPHAVARAAYDAWQKASKSIDPMVWCANWAAKLPPPPKPKEPYRDLEG
jgi:hypothetical protein